MGGVPSKSGFNWYSTADQTIRDVSLSGKNIIVTGANTGMVVLGVCHCSLLLLVMNCC